MIPPSNSSSTNAENSKGRKRNQAVLSDFTSNAKRPYGISQNIRHSHSSLGNKENVSHNCNPAKKNLGHSTLANLGGRFPYIHFFVFFRIRKGIRRIVGLSRNKARNRMKADIQHKPL
ncbi:hypothetical protein AgCh_040065 [Apium graveolens]